MTIQAIIRYSFKKTIYQKLLLDVITHQKCMSGVIPFGLKNASDKYKGAMDLISHDLINHNIKI